MTTMTRDELVAPHDVPSAAQQIEARLAALLPQDESAVLHCAMRAAVLSGGKRLRPRLLLAVAEACAASGEALDLALASACALELVHCASLVHDDLPSFDDAAERRGQPTVHVRYGEAVAILAGDALLALGFEALTDSPPALARRALRVLRLLSKATGASEGIIGGQALEAAPLAAEGIDRYHSMKTAALFRFAAAAGALAAGAVDPAAWAALGERLGLLYQLADDLMDHSGAAGCGKPTGQDRALQRPNAAQDLGVESAQLRLRTLLSDCQAQVLALASDPRPLLALLRDLDPRR